MLNLAVVGLGKWGLRHAHSAAASGRFNVVKGVDTGKVDVDFPVTASLDEVLSDPSIDAVSIATPHTLHAQQISSAAKAGKHILTEKPFALSLADGQANAQLARENGIVLALGHDHRFYPVVDALKAMIGDGSLGKVTTVQSVLSHNFTAEPLKARNLAKNNAGAPTDPSTWWRLNLKEAPVGPMVHLGIHHLDLFIHLFGKIDWVLASSPTQTLDTEIPDTMLVTLGFADGQIGTINSSLASPLNSRMLVSGSEGWAEALGPDDVKAYTKSSLTQIRKRLGDELPNTESYPVVDSVAENFAAFADAIEGKADYPITIEQMLHNAAVLEAIVRSSHEKVVAKVEG
jgi:predicted dehydrogenase